MRSIRSLVVVCCVAGLLPAVASAQGRGVSPDGNEGVIHKVVNGDTLWDIATTYMGTPWIWPSIWKENEGIENPHLIYPGDLIWISEREMRKLTPEEAEALMAARLEQAPEQRAGESLPAEAAPVAPPHPEPTAAATLDPFAALDQGDAGIERKIRVSGLDSFSFVTPDEVKASGTIMGNHDQNYWSSQEQTTIISVGEGQAHTGDSFMVYRVRRRVLHPATGELLGYFIQVLGRAEVTEMHPEASYVKVVEAYSEIQPGDRVVPYIESPTAIAVVLPEDDIEGQVIAYQPYRQRSGEGDFVLIDRGVDHGVVPGNHFSLFRAGREVRDPATLVKVLVPDDVIGELFVVKSAKNTSLARVMSARNEVFIGDHFRTAD